MLGNTHNRWKKARLVVYIWETHFVSSVAILCWDDASCVINDLQTRVSYVRGE